MEDIKYSQRVLIVVKGGVVQSLYVSNRLIEVDIIDFDNEIYDDDLSEEEELKKRSIGLLPVL